MTTIVRAVSVDRTRSRQTIIAATGREQHVNAEVLATMPLLEGSGGTELVLLYAFPIERSLTPDEWDAELASRGLVPDFAAIAALNEQDPGFADLHPNGAQWRNVEAHACFLTFDRWNGNRSVVCERNEGPWRLRWWAVGSLVS